MLWTIRHISTKSFLPILEGTLPRGGGGCLAAIRGKDKMLPLVEIAAAGGEKKIRYFRSVSARLQCFQTPRNDKLSGSDNN